MSSADTWTGRVFLFDRELAQLDRLPLTAALPVDTGPTAFARGLVVPISHAPLDPDQRELLELAPEAEGLALVATAEARKTLTPKAFETRLRSRFGAREASRAEQDQVRDELLAEAESSLTGHTGLFDLQTGIALIPDGMARDTWFRTLLANACGVTLESLETAVISTLLTSWVLGETPVPPPFKPGCAITLESPLDPSKSSFEGCLATSADIRAQITEYQRFPVRMALQHADIELEVRDPFAVRVAIEHSGLRSLRKEASNPSSAAQHRAYLQELAPRLRPVLTWLASHFGAPPDTTRWQHPAGQRDDLMTLLGSAHDPSLARPGA